MTAKPAIRVIMKALRIAYMICGCTFVHHIQFSCASLRALVQVCGKITIGTSITGTTKLPTKK
jgi:hypothetical protein